MAKEGSIYRKGDYEYQVRGGKAYNFNVPKKDKKSPAPVKKAVPTPAPKPTPKADAAPSAKAPAIPSAPVPEKVKPEAKAKTKTPQKSAQQEYDALRKTPKTYERDYEATKKYDRQPDQKWYNFFGEQQGGAKKRAFKNSPDRYRPAEMSNGGKVRGDGASRIKTKGRCI